MHFPNMLVFRNLFKCKISNDHGMFGEDVVENPDSHQSFLELRGNEDEVPAGDPLTSRLNRFTNSIRHDILDIFPTSSFPDLRLEELVTIPIKVTSNKPRTLASVNKLIGELFEDEFRIIQGSGVEIALGIAVEIGPRPPVVPNMES